MKENVITTHQERKINIVESITDAPSLQNLKKHSNCSWKHMKLFLEIEN